MVKKLLIAGLGIAVLAATALHPEVYWRIASRPYITEVPKDLRPGPGGSGAAKWGMTPQEVYLAEYPSKWRETSEDIYEGELRIGNSRYDVSWVFDERGLFTVNMRLLAALPNGALDLARFENRLVQKISADFGPPIQDWPFFIDSLKERADCIERYREVQWLSTDTWVELVSNRDERSTYVTFTSARWSPGEPIPMNGEY